MSKVRIIHSRITLGDILISDIDDGMPDEALGTYHKQNCYVPYSYRVFRNNALVVDANKPGYVDLVYSDKVKLSLESGVIASHVASGYMTSFEFDASKITAPTIATAVQDTADATDATNDYRLVITGTNLSSLSPHATTVTVTDGTTTTVLTEDEIFGGGGSITETEIVIPAAVHGYAVDESENLTSVTVEANDQTVTSAIAVI